MVLALAFTGMLIVVLSGANGRLREIPLDAQFGLLQLLPPAFWFGLSLMGLAMGLAVWMRSDILIAITGVLFFATFAGTRMLFEPNPAIWDGYLHVGEALESGAAGHLPASMEKYSANWPGFFLDTWFLLATTNIPPVSLLWAFPFLTGGLTFLALFVFLRFLIPGRAAAWSAVFGSLLNVWAQYWAAPQSVGLFLFFLVLATLWRRDIASRLANAILFLGLVVTHPTSTILLLAILFTDMGISYASRLRRATPETAPDEGISFAHNPAIAYGVTWLGWLFLRATGSAQVATTTIAARIGFILQVPEQAVNLATRRTAENLFMWPPLIRLACLAVFGLVVVRTLVLLRRESPSRGLMRFLIAIVGGAMALAFVDILAFRGELYDRSLMLFAALAPAICMLGLEPSRARHAIRVPVLAILVAASLAAASTAYYQESFYFVSSEAVAVSEFLQRVNPDSLVLDGLYPVPIWRASHTSPLRIGFYEVYPRPFGDFYERPTAYAVFDGTALIWYRQYRGVETYRFYEASRWPYPLIYNNGHAQIYFIH